MLNTNITAFRKNIFSMIEQAIKYNEPINISTKEGNAVVLSEDDYQGLIATLNLLSNDAMREKLLAGKETPLDDCISEEEVSW